MIRPAIGRADYATLPTAVEKSLCPAVADLYRIVPDIRRLLPKCVFFDAEDRPFQPMAIFRQCTGNVQRPFQSENPARARAKLMVKPCLR